MNYTGFADRMASQLRKPSGGFFGRLVEIIMSLGNTQTNQWIILLIDIQSTDRVFEVGFGPGLAIERVGPES